jgi:hypothetical protein
MAEQQLSGPDPLLEMMARAVVMVPESAVAEAVAAEREAIRLRILGCVTCGKVHEYREGTFADPDNHHVYRPRFRHGMPGAAAELAALIGGDQ